MGRSLYPVDDDDVVVVVAKVVEEEEGDAIFDMRAMLQITGDDVEMLPEEAKITFSLLTIDCEIIGVVVVVDIATVVAVDSGAAKAALAGEEK